MASNPNLIFAKIPDSVGSDHINAIILNDQKYWLQVIVDDGENRKDIPNALIESIKISEHMLFFETRVQITYHDPFFLFSNIFGMISAKFGCETVPKDKYYNFKSSNKEKIHLKMVPLPDGSNTGDPSSFPPHVWHIQCELSIDSITNIGIGNDDTHIRLHCVDYQWNELKSKKLDDWNCGLEGGNKYRNGEIGGSVLSDFSGFGNSAAQPTVKNLPPYPHRLFPQAKALKTGEGVYAAMERAGLTDHLPIIDTGKSESEKRLVLAESEYGKLPEKQKEEDVWDFGSENNRVFTGSITDWTALDYLSYYLSWHGSGLIAANSSTAETSGENNTPSLDPCFLSLERPDKENAIRKYNLKSLLHYFEQAGSTKDDPGPYHRENFFITHGEMANSVNVLRTIRSPLSKICNKMTGITPRDQTAVLEYQTVPVDPSDSRKYLKTHIAIFNNPQINSNIQVKATPEEVKNYIADNYLKNMYTQDGGSIDNVIFSLTEDKLQNKEELSIRIDIPTSEAARIASRNKLLMSVIFLNRVLSWRVKGSTHRQVGRFCGVDRIDSNDEADFENEVLGQYLVTSVIHDIDLKGKDYQNEMTGIKYFTFKVPNQPAPEP